MQDLGTEVVIFERTDLPYRGPAPTPRAYLYITSLTSADGVTENTSVMPGLFGRAMLETCG